MCFQRLIIPIADRQAFIIPDLPAGFIQGFKDRQDSISVFMRIADEDKRLFLVCQERRSELLIPLRKQAVKRFKLVVKYKRAQIVQAVLMCV